jgi:glycosyltransferase involved in cell wall biosynthesis
MDSIGRLGGLRLWWTRNRLENALSMYRGFALLGRQQSYDVVEMPECGAEGLLINYLRPPATVVRFHSPAQFIMPSYDVRRADIRLCAFLERLAARRGRAFTSCSRFLADEVRDKLRWRRPIRVIPNGIDVELFDAVEQVDIRRRLGIRRDQLMIVFTGRMEPRKGIFLCKEIAAHILERYDLAFVFAGQDLFNYMAQTLLPHLRSKKLKGVVHYLGQLSMAEVRSCVKQADILLIPSLWENCPYACLEAMAAGRAIVASNQGGMPELIRDGDNGLLARTRDPSAFIAALERLIEAKSLRERLGTAARATIEESFTDLQVARLSVDYYRDSLATSLPSRPASSGEGPCPDRSSGFAGRTLNDGHA